MLSSCVKTRNFTQNRPKKVEFFDNFAAELDIFDTEQTFPSWMFEVREQQLRKISPELRRVCYYLRELGLKFKIKWPIEVGGRWKFADVYFPGKGTVVTLTNAMALIGRPHWMMSDKGEFFARGGYRVVEIENVAELERKVVNKRETKAVENICVTENK